MTLIGRKVDRNLIRRVGWDVLWYKALLCPKRRTDNQIDHTCSACDDRGYIYTSPKSIKGIFHSDNRDETFNVAGAWETGSSRFTYAAHEDIGVEDKIIVISHPVRDGLVLTKGSLDLDRIRTLNAVELLAVQTETTTYNVDTDCSLQVDGDGTSYIKWLTGASAPSEGDRYSILFTLKPTWIVSAHPMVRAFGSTNKLILPHVVALKRYDHSVEG